MSKTLGRRINHYLIALDGERTGCIGVGLMPIFPTIIGFIHDNTLEGLLAGAGLSLIYLAKALYHRSEREGIAASHAGLIYPYKAYKTFYEDDRSYYLKNKKEYNAEVKRVSKEFKKEVERYRERKRRQSFPKFTLP